MPNSETELPKANRFLHGSPDWSFACKLGFIYTPQTWQTNDKGQIMIRGASRMISWANRFLAAARLHPVSPSHDFG